ncbi:hypothetical protein G6011_07162 [Alternaria panax]|uniref:SH3 domain-containing protein n=1 Tax=Alternaria panax TaxID=48097 RepID=A0AAD4I6V1_9PLEO|nr:hypothetical protein G6011_07162 [Alternaria panax]
MSSASPRAIIVTTMLNTLEPLPPDHYMIALSRCSDQFFATPSGYSSTYLPNNLLSEICGGYINKITWASYGSKPGSWFFACERKDGTSAFMIGPDIPSALQSYIQAVEASETLRCGIRVQLGAANSFVVWSGTAWACADVPPQLEAKLCEGSSASREGNKITNGSLRDSRTLDNVQWHANGSYYIKSGDRHLWNFQAKLVRLEWNRLWTGVGRDERMSKIDEELAYVFINPHTQNGETFAFVKKHSAGLDAPFVVHFEGEPIHGNLDDASSQSKLSSSPLDTASDTDSFQDSHPQPLVRHGPHTPDQRMQHAPRKSEEEVPFQWATAKQSGRPHKAESWELVLRKGEQIKVIRDMGRDWFVVIDMKGVKGFVHGSWLAFGDRTVCKDAKAAHRQFMEDLLKLLNPGQLQAFPAMISYVDECTRADCQPLKEDISQLGICTHDLSVLLQASDKYSHEWLKEGRNLWHPDRFARFCHPDHTERLKLKAEQMFIMYGILMEACKA